MRVIGACRGRLGCEARDEHFDLRRVLWAHMHLPHTVKIHGFLTTAHSIPPIRRSVRTREFSLSHKCCDTGVRSEAFREFEWFRMLARRSVPGRTRRELCAAIARVPRLGAGFIFRKITRRGSWVETQNFLGEKFLSYRRSIGLGNDVWLLLPTEVGWAACRASEASGPVSANLTGLGKLSGPP